MNLYKQKKLKKNLMGEKRYWRREKSEDLDLCVEMKEMIWVPKL